MSKSLGNSPDPLDLIKKYGADGVRVGMLLSSPAGNDLLFDSSLCEQGRNFTNKVWNSFRLISSWTVSEEIEQAESSIVALKWIESKISENIDKINANILWNWKGDKEYQETKQAIIDDRKRLQKFANRVASRKRASLKELEACKLFLNTLIDNEKYFKQIKEIRDKAKLVS